MTPHEFVSQEGWWVCIWCKRTGKDKSLFDKIDCKRPDGLRVDDDSGEHHSPLEAVLMSQTRAVSDDLLRTMASDPKVVYEQVSKDFRRELTYKNRVLLENPVLKDATPMSTMPGYSILKIEALTAQGVEVKVRKTAAAMPESLMDTYNVLSASNMLADIMKQEVDTEIKRRSQHMVVGEIFYSQLPYGPDHMQVTATFLMIPKKLYETHEYAALPQDVL